ncbi:MAG: hypothetical protein MK100_06830 [Phycisphaerales bacterium]|nr:hypothetical protein [Phycisphaerales bacterium]
MSNENKSNGTGFKVIVVLLLLVIAGVNAWGVLKSTVVWNGIIGGEVVCIWSDGTAQQWVSKKTNQF